MSPSHTEVALSIHMFMLAFQIQLCVLSEKMLAHLVLWESQRKPWWVSQMDKYASK